VSASAVSVTVVNALAGVVGVAAADSFCVDSGVSATAAKTVGIVDVIVTNFAGVVVVVVVVVVGDDVVVFLIFGRMSLSRSQ
jgi:type IV secretory pathway VirB2 component (pilin)